MRVEKLLEDARAMSTEDLQRCDAHLFAVKEEDVLYDFKILEDPLLRGLLALHHKLLLRIQTFEEVDIGGLLPQVRLEYYELASACNLLDAMICNDLQDRYFAEMPKVFDGNRHSVMVAHGWRVVLVANKQPTSNLLIVTRGRPRDQTGPVAPPHKH